MLRLDMEATVLLEMLPVCDDGYKIMYTIHFI
jgi:hypothetical protein